MPGPASKSVMSDAARPNVIEMHRCLRDKDEQLLNAQQEISRIRREHALRLRRRAMIQKGELANPGSRGVRQKILSLTQTCLKSEVRQGRRGGKDHGV